MVQNKLHACNSEQVVERIRKTLEHCEIAGLDKLLLQTNVEQEALCAGLRALLAHDHVERIRPVGLERRPDAPFDFSGREHVRLRRPMDRAYLWQKRVMSEAFPQPGSTLNRFSQSKSLFIDDV